MVADRRTLTLMSLASQMMWAHLGRRELESENIVYELGARVGRALYEENDGLTARMGDGHQGGPDHD